MENLVEGVDVDPEEFNHPDWTDVRRRQRSLQTSHRQADLPPATTPNAGKEQPPPPRRRRPAARPPPQIPLPSEDVKVILRPRGGLDVSALPPATIADAVLTQANLPLSHADQIRPHRIANYILVSTPSEERAKTYAAITSLLIKNQAFPVSAHVAAPSDTVTGVIFNIPEDDTEEQVYKSICEFNPELPILDAKRLNTSNMAQILFHGTRVPFWVRYRSTTYRCRPFRRKTEACPLCWSSGHRPDVCPRTKLPPRCPRCGQVNPTEQHPCHAQCIVCGGAHLTGSSDCPRRYQPKRRTSTYAQIASQNLSQSATTPPSRGEEGPRRHPPGPGSSRQTGRGPGLSHRSQAGAAAWPPLQGAAGTTHQASNLLTPQVSCLAPSTHCSEPFSSSHSVAYADVLKELAAIKAEIVSLKKENEALRQENQMLRTHASPSRAESSPSPPPPVKRKAVSDAPSALEAFQEQDAAFRDQIAQVESKCTQALATQQAEYICLHQTLLANIGTIQGNIESWRAEMQSNIRELFAAVNALTTSRTPLPDSDELTDEM